MTFPESPVALLVEYSYWGYLLPVITTLAALILGYFSHYYVSQLQVRGARDEAERQLKDAEREATNIIREAHLQATQEGLQIREKQETELQELRVLVESKEQRLEEQKARLGERMDAFEEEKVDLRIRQEALDALAQTHRTELAKVASLPLAEAREMALADARKSIQAEADALRTSAVEEAHAAADIHAREVLITSMERLAADTTSTQTVTTVDLPKEEWKGRLIGKEGRNIQAFEQATGVSLIIDDTPCKVTLSTFDPLRREIARRSLAALIADGRIHPASIEETVGEKTEEMGRIVEEEGRKAVDSLNIDSIDPCLYSYIGRLGYRTSYNQNQLQHALEMAHLMATMAAELGLDPEPARRIGLLHDIGKALVDRQGVSHAVAGAALLEQCGESPEVVNAVAAHHREVEPTSPYAGLTVVADTITAARPGARIDSTDQYHQRLEHLEKTALDLPGVEKAFAIQAGRELRVVVRPEEVDDDAARELAKDIRKRIEGDPAVQGRVKVLVVREQRWIEHAG